MKPIEDKIKFLIKYNTGNFCEGDEDEIAKVERATNLGIELSKLVHIKDFDGICKRMHLNPIRTFKDLTVITGYSQEAFKSFLTNLKNNNEEDFKLLRVSLKFNKWQKPWTPNTLLTGLKEDKMFRTQVVKLFLVGYTLPKFNRAIEQSLCNYKRVAYFCQNQPEFLHSIVANRLKGSFAGRRGHKVEDKLKDIFDSEGIPYEGVVLPGANRNVDIIVPNKNNPKIVCESSFVSATGSGLDDKAKTIKCSTAKARLLYPECNFLGFFDGAGWLNRKEALKIAVEELDDVFTFHQESITIFKENYINGKL